MTIRPHSHGTSHLCGHRHGATQQCGQTATGPFSSVAIAIGPLNYVAMLQLRSYTSTRGRGYRPPSYGATPGNLRRCSQKPILPFLTVTAVYHKAFRKSRQHTSVYRAGYSRVYQGSCSFICLKIFNIETEMHSN